MVFMILRTSYFGHDLRSPSKAGFKINRRWCHPPQMKGKGTGECLFVCHQETVHLLSVSDARNSMFDSACSSWSRLEHRTWRAWMLSSHTSCSRSPRIDCSSLNRTSVDSSPTWTRLPKPLECKSPLDVCVCVCVRACVRARKDDLSFTQKH